MELRYLQDSTRAIQPISGLKNMAAMTRGMKSLGWLLWFLDQGLFTARNMEIPPEIESMYFENAPLTDGAYRTISPGQKISIHPRVELLL